LHASHYEEHRRRRGRRVWRGTGRAGRPDCPQRQLEKKPGLSRPTVARQNRGERHGRNVLFLGEVGTQALSGLSGQRAAFASERREAVATRNRWVAAVVVAVRTTDLFDWLSTRDRSGGPSRAGPGLLRETARGIGTGRIVGSALPGRSPQGMRTTGPVHPAPHRPRHKRNGSSLAVAGHA
jgi:hypothetical protein